MISIRSEREIDLLRQANQIVAAAHKKVAELIAPGITTEELDRAVENLILDAGATPAFKGYHGYPASICVSIDEEVVHGIPSKRKLAAGQLVSVDIGACYKGYYGDAALTHACGSVDETRLRLLDITDLALSRAIRVTKAGNYLNDIGIIVEQTAVDAGFSVVRNYVGHGIGVEMHEDPQIFNFDAGEPGPRLEEGMVLAIEPMVNAGTFQVRVKPDNWTVVTKDGQPSAHFEHTVVVRKDGAEILSYCDGPIWGVRTD
ncbi:MAG: type I methionyl aminopeptidase [Candidatus Hydrogenedentes bacterium]|jgi:methionyl aminopeptidase|nr:type I methionyl aminopeptidase [Candidatus Hydrogenedentota bacterium]